MPLENPDINAMVDDASSAEQRETPSEKPTRGPTRYIRQALIRIFRMSSEERENYKPKNGFEEAALAHVKRCCSTAGIGTAAFNSLRESIGESVSKQKAEESGKKTAPGFELIDDMPRANRKVQ